MMNKLSRIAMLAVVLMALVSANAFSQAAQPTRTTLSAAMAYNATRLTVASATGFVASNQTSGLQYGVFIDHEFMQIVAVSGTTITVFRGQANTNITPHKSGAVVFVGQFGSQPQSGTQVGGPFVQTPYQGACTATDYPIMPLIQVNANAIDGQAMYNCLGGQWYRQDLPDDALDQTPGATQAKYCTIPIGSVAYGSLGTSTAMVNGTIYNGSIYIPSTFIGTGISVLAAGTTGTTLVDVALYDSGGRKITTSALAGAVLGAANTFTKYAFTATQIITGPARYFVAVQGNGTDTIRTVAGSTYITIVGSSNTGTFGTFPSLTLPTTLISDTAPIACTY